MTRPNARPILDMNAFDRQTSESRPEGLLARRLANFGASSVLFYRDPIEMVSARGAWLESASGERYLDFYNNVPSVGHCHPQVVEALSRQIARLNINSRYLNRVVDDYLETLKRRLPTALENITLTCSGSEANDLAMRVAMKASEHRGFIVTESAYHGNTLAVTEISPSALRQSRLPAQVIAIPAPSSQAYGHAVADGLNAAVRVAAEELDRRGFGLAALICDSIFSSDGVYAAPAGFLAPAVTTARRFGGLYIADEVQPGFARTGDHFWGFEAHGVTPDIVTMGKPMGNGYPMAGMAVTPDALAAFCEDVGYFNTFGGTPAAAAAGQAVLEVIEQEGLQENARRVGAYLFERLQALASQGRDIGEVRGRGLFIGIEISQDRDLARPDPERAAELINRLRYEHILIGAAGRFGNTLKVRPPLCLSCDEADLFVDALARVLG